jgi:hypothetical protein
VCSSNPYNRTTQPDVACFTARLYGIITSLFAHGDAVQSPVVAGGMYDNETCLASLYQLMSFEFKVSQRFNPDDPLCYHR